jgi:tetratricopeptide (TPR) repeat protein
MSTDIDTIKGNYVEQNLGTIVQLLNEPKNPIATQIVYNLAGFGKVYGRDAEAKILGDALCGKGEFADRRFCLIVAPSGFGKSFLLSKTLQDISDGTIIYPGYRQIVQRIIRLDCRHTQSVADIVSQFTNIIGLSFSYPQDFGHPFDYLNGVLFHYVRGIGNVWLILDNFEAWLDGENDYQPINGEVEAFLKALFEGNHSMRGVFLSQSLPVNFIRQQLKILETVGDNLYKGLPETDALRMLKTEGESVGLNEVGDDLLIEFLQKVAYIPQAINSLLGYMQDGITLQEVLHTPDFQQGFEEYESDTQKVEAGERRTNALIARQIKAQSADIQLLLQALAYFARPLPIEALEILFDNKLRARNAINRLKTHRLASETKDITGTNYYDLHAYFRKQIKKVLPDFSRIVNVEYANTLLYNKGTEFINKGFLQKAVDLSECAEKIYRELFNNGRTDLEYDIAGANNNKGIALDSQGKLDEAITSYDDAINIYQRMVNELKLDRFISDLAMCYWGRGNVLNDQDKLDEAIIGYDDAINIYESLVNELELDQFSNDLATVYMNKGNVLYFQGKLDAAIKSYDKSEKTREGWLQRGRYQILPSFIWNIQNRIEALLKLEDWQRTAGDVVAAFDFAGHWRGVELSEHFRKQIKEHRDIIIRQLQGVSAEKRKEIYKHAGEFGGKIKQLVEDFEEDEKNPDIRL